MIYTPTQGLCTEDRANDLVDLEDGDTQPTQIFVDATLQLIENAMVH